MADCGIPFLQRWFLYRGRRTRSTSTTREEPRPSRQHELWRSGMSSVGDVLIGRSEFRCVNFHGGSSPCLSTNRQDKARPVRLSSPWIVSDQNQAVAPAESNVPRREHSGPSPKEMNEFIAEPACCGIRRDLKGNKTPPRYHLTFIFGHGAVLAQPILFALHCSSL